MIIIYEQRLSWRDDSLMQMDLDSLVSRGCVISGLGMVFNFATARDVDSMLGWSPAGGFDCFDIFGLRVVPF